MLDFSGYVRADQVPAIDGLVLQVAAGIGLADACSQDRGEPVDLVVVARAVCSFDGVEDQHRVARSTARPATVAAFAGPSPPGGEFDAGEDAGDFDHFGGLLGDQWIDPVVAVLGNASERSPSDGVEFLAQFPGVDLLGDECAAGESAEVVPVGADGWVEAAVVVPGELG